MDVQQLVREVTVRGSFQGAGEVSRGYDQIASSADKAAGAVDRQSKAQESSERALDKLRRQYQDGYREQQKISEAERTYQRAVDQGLISKAAAATELGNIKVKLDQLSTSQRASSAVWQEVQSRAQAASGSLGGVASVLGGLSPALFGIVGIAGAAVVAINAMSTSAHELAEKAQELRRFADVTGLTTTQVQALRSEASKFGLTGEEVQNSVQAFTAKFEQLRLGEGELLAQVRRVNPAIAEQMQVATNAGDALTLLGQALAQTDNVFQRNSLVKAATNRGGLANANFLTGLDVGQLTKSFADAGKGLDETLIKKLAQLNVEIAKLQAQAKQALAEGFSEGQLEREKSFAKEWLDFARSARDFALSGDLRFLLQTVASVRIGGKGTLLGDAFGIDFSAGYKAPASAAPAASFAQRFQPALDNPLGALKLPGAANDNSGQKTLEAQVADLKKLIEVLGPAATESQKLALRQKELQLTARDAGTSADVLARAQRAVNEEFRVNALRETVSTLGQAATQAEQYNLKVGELKQKVDQGRISQETFNRAIADFRQTQQIEQMRETISALGGAATESEKYKLKLAELQQKLDQGKISQQTFNRAALEADPIFQMLKSGAESFATTLVDGLLDGKNFVDTLKSAFDGLAKSMANAAIKDLFSGNFEKAGIEAVIAIGAKIAGNLLDNSQEKELEKAKLAWSQMTEQLQQFNLTAQGFDLSGPAAALRSLFDTAVELAKAANAAHDMAGLVQVVSGFVAGMSRIVNEFANPAIGLSQSAEQIKSLRDQAAALIQTLKDIGQFSQGAADAINGGLLKQIKAIQDALADSLRADINEATGLGFVNSIDALIKKKSQLIAENDAPVELISQWFTAGVQAVVDQLDQSDFQKFKDTFGDLATTVHESTKAIEDQAAAQKALQDELNSTARTTVDFVNQFLGGSSSVLSPQLQLASAQSTYQSQYALASGGNAEAQKTITQYADAYIKALQANFASAASGSINVILGQLLSLPAVQQTTDPVVQALRDNLTAINSVALAIGLTTGAVDRTTGAVGLTTGAVGASQAAIIAALDLNHDGIVDQSEILAAISGSTASTVNNTANTRTAIDLVRNSTDLVKSSTDLVKSAVDSVASVSSSINNSATRVVNAINNHGAMSQSAFVNFSDHLAHIRGGTNFIANSYPGRFHRQWYCRDRR
jgi:hypothetical protein